MPHTIRFWTAMLLLLPSAARTQTPTSSSCTARSLGEPHPIRVGSSVVYIEKPSTATNKKGTLQVGLPTWIYRIDSTDRVPITQARGVFVDRKGRARAVPLADQSSGWAFVATASPERFDMYWTPSDPSVGVPEVTANELRMASYDGEKWSNISTVVRDERLNASSTAIWNMAELGQYQLVMGASKRVDTISREGAILMVEHNNGRTVSEWIKLGSNAMSPAMVAVSSRANSPPLVSFIAALKPEVGSWGVYVMEKNIPLNSWSGPHQLRSFGADSTAFYFQSVTTPAGDHHLFWLDTKGFELKVARLSHVWRVQGDTIWRSETIPSGPSKWTAISSAPLSGNVGIAALTTESGSVALLQFDSKGSALVNSYALADFSTVTNYSIRLVQGNVMDLSFVRLLESTGSGSSRDDRKPVTVHTEMRIECAVRNK